MTKQLRSFRWLVLAALAGVVPALTAATYTVTSANDSGVGSLREAITAANAQPGADTIVFNLPGTGPKSITLAAALPAITDPVTLDATTQPGYAGKPLVELNGANAGAGAFGLIIMSDDCVVRGLAINRFARDGIRIESHSRNVVQGNFLGTDTTGTLRLGLGENGVGIANGAGNLVGGTNAGAGNVLSACGQNGVIIAGAYATGNQVVGNRIGTDITGTVALGNTNSGVVITNASGNLVGGVVGGARNLISGNGQSGVFLLGPFTSSNRVEGNFIGTDAAGRTAIMNQADGITLTFASENIIGGLTPGAKNLVSGNAQDGIFLGRDSTRNIVQGNYLGTDVTGTGSIGNGNGMGISRAADNLLGGGAPGARNLISGNKEAGVYFEEAGTVFNRLQGNYIGSDITGTRALGNTYWGVIITAASNYIGGAELGEGNLISGNNNVGVSINYAASSGNVVQGNFIGLQADGVSPLGNLYHGIQIQYGASGTLVGGTTPGAGNRIGFARTGLYAGVRVQDDNSSGNTVRCNSIFSNAGLGLDLGVNGVTPNDAGDADLGPNSLQNYPVVSSVSGRFRTEIQGTLNSQAGSLYLVDFYVSPQADANLYGEGSRWLGTIQVTTDSGGAVSFTAVFTNTAALVGVITATATDASGNTSEFSMAVANVFTPEGDSDGDGLPDDYERAWGLNPADPSDALADADGDGASNLAEYQAGTNPLLATDAVRFVQLPLIVAMGTELVFNPSFGRIHRVEFTTQPVGPWQLVATNLLGLGRPMRVMDTNAMGTQRIYRLRAE